MESEKYLIYKMIKKIQKKIYLDCYFLIMLLVVIKMGGFRLCFESKVFGFIVSEQS